jgi:hypothetical protein
MVMMMMMISLTSSKNETYETCFRQNITETKTYVLFSLTFCRKSCRLGVNVENVCRARQATDDNVTHAHCILDDKGESNTQNMQYLIEFVMR